jgi:hypothetical protein
MARKIGFSAYIGGQGFPTMARKIWFSAYIGGQGFPTMT